MTLRLESGSYVPVIDLHAHLRNEVKRHTLIAKASGIDFVAAMPNTVPCLDTVETIKEYRKTKSAIPFGVVSAITKGREGKELVDVDNISDYAIAFTDDGNCLKDMKILNDALQMGAWVFQHAGEDPPATDWPRDTNEPEYVEKCLAVNRDAKGRLLFQHISRKESVDLIRWAKKDGIYVIAETCPHYCKWTRNTMRVPVNPAIGDKEDKDAVNEGLSDGTIDIMSSDYAPEPRPKGTGIADWENYRSFCKQLVADGILTEDQLISAVYGKPLEIIKSTRAYKSGNIWLPDW